MKYLQAFSLISGFTILLALLFTGIGWLGWVFLYAIPIQIWIMSFLFSLVITFVWFLD